MQNYIETYFVNSQSLILENPANDNPSGHTKIRIFKSTKTFSYSPKPVIALCDNALLIYCKTDLFRPKEH